MRDDNRRVGTSNGFLSVPHSYPSSPSEHAANVRELERVVNDIPLAAPYEVFQGAYDIAMVSSVLGDGVWSGVSGASTSGSGPVGLLPATAGLWTVKAYCTLTGTAGDLFEPSIGNGVPPSGTGQTSVRSGGTGTCSIVWEGGLAVGGGFPLYVGVQYDAGTDWSMHVSVSGRLVRAV